MDPADRPTRRSYAHPAAPVILPFPGSESARCPDSSLEPAASLTFLEELELRQDEVLQQLDDLDRRVAALIEEYVQARDLPAA
jgi:hypothetical protein